MYHMAKTVVRAKLVENVRSVADNNRVHSVVCDLPTDSGGTDMGPTALELALMALADCAVTIYADVAKRSKVEITNLEAVAEAEKSPDSPKIGDVSLKIKVTSKARKQLLEAIWRRTEANCPVLAIFKEPITIKAELEASSE